MASRRRHQVCLTYSPGEGESNLTSSGIDARLCFDPYEVLKRAWFIHFSTPKRYQKRQHTEVDMHVDISSAVSASHITSHSMIEELGSSQLT